MTISDLYTLLSDVLPGKVVYNAWKVGEAPPLPYVVYYSAGASNFAADNVVYGSRRDVRIELYSQQKDFSIETGFEAALTTAGIYWTRDESFIAEENVFMTIYEVKING